LEKAEKAAAVKAMKKRKTLPQWGGASKGQQQRPQEQMPMPARGMIPGTTGAP